MTSYEELTPEQREQVDVAEQSGVAYNKVRKLSTSIRKELALEKEALST